MREYMCDLEEKEEEEEENSSDRSIIKEPRKKIPTDWTRFTATSHPPPLSATPRNLFHWGARKRVRACVLARLNQTRKTYDTKEKRKPKKTSRLS